MTPREIAASEFKQRCLALLDQVKDDRVSYVVTKHGKPVAIVTPIPVDERKPLKGSITFLTDNEEELLSTGEEWPTYENWPDDDLE